MKVHELRKLLESLPDNGDVIIWTRDRQSGESEDRVALFNYIETEKGAESIHLCYKD